MPIQCYCNCRGCLSAFRRIQVLSVRRNPASIRRPPRRSSRRDANQVSFSRCIRPIRPIRLILPPLVGNASRGGPDLRQPMISGRCTSSWHFACGISRSTRRPVRRGRRVDAVVAAAVAVAATPTALRMAYTAPLSPFPQSVSPERHKFVAFLPRLATDRPAPVSHASHCRARPWWSFPGWGGLRMRRACARAD